MFRHIETNEVKSYRQWRVGLGMSFPETNPPEFLEPYTPEPEPTPPPTKEDLRRELQEQRDQALQQMQHEVEGVGVVQTRPQDIINLQTAISLGQTREWVLADNSVGTLTTEQMQECLQAGMTQGQLIWDDYIEELKLL